MYFVVLPFAGPRSSSTGAQHSRMLKWSSSTYAKNAYDSSYQSSPSTFMPRTPSQPAPSVHPNQVLRRFRVVFNAVRSHFKQIEKEVGLGGAQVWALSVIRDQPGIGMGGLAKCMDVHQSTASNLVRNLLQKELIRMDKATTDKRHVHLHITPQALALLADVPGPFEGVLPAALAELDHATLQRLDQDLAELIARLKADESAGAIPLAQL
jgi:DNA-binding MarR family transcriptional regulator